jgi:hypothetical protein
MLAMRRSEEWVQYFRGNGLVAMRVPWHLGADLTEEEKAAIAHSIRVFQLGESSEGRHLMKYARAWAERSRDAAYAEAIRMLIAEEQRHAATLARFMELNGIARLRSGFSDRVFRRLRNILGSLEISIGVLVTAEIIAKVYYPVLRAATTSIVLRTICEQIQRDEIAHVVFQTEQLARLRANRSRAARWATTTLHRMLFYPTILLVACSHHAVLRRGRLGLSSFFRICRREFLLDLAAMNPRARTAAYSPESRNGAITNDAAVEDSLIAAFDGGRMGSR